MKQITRVRKTVCTMANELKKAGYSLSEAFRKAWQRVKLTMTIRAAGTTFENRQPKVLQYIMGHTNISVTLDVYTHLDFSQIQGKMESVQKNMRIG